MTEVPTGIPAGELSDEELESQGKQLHETRNWMFLHGTAAQFETHTKRMLELEQEYLARHPKRTWQRSGGAEGADPPQPAEDPVCALLQRVADAPDGRMHKLEVHQAAREVGLDRTSLAQLYKDEPKLLATQGADRVITEEGRRRLER